MAVEMIRMGMGTVEVQGRIDVRVLVNAARVRRGEVPRGYAVGLEVRVGVHVVYPLRIMVLAMGRIKHLHSPSV